MTEPVGQATVPGERGKRKSVLGAITSTVLIVAGSWLWWGFSDVDGSWFSERKGANPCCRVM